jgi:alkanesulfonate monooxygenase SsuD/methylene tetrahydromethanopterin reductase-like flavin-dependent oxidoreductase (luciferase family)
MDVPGAEVRKLEAAGLDSVTPWFSRTPALLGMTAAGLDYLSNGRFRLGIGASGPQVVEDFRGALYAAPRRAHAPPVALAFRIAWPGGRYLPERVLAGDLSVSKCQEPR